jgi:formate-dependent nitrite reductase membrane component NrfD
MADFNKQLKERWQTKRKKASSWSSLLLKIFLFVAILYVIHSLSTNKNIDWSKFKAKADTVQTTP